MDYINNMVALDMKVRKIIASERSENVDF